jgi:hypothetical protein
LVHEHVVLGPAKTGIDLAPRKSVSEEWLAVFHPIDRLLQAQERAMSRLMLKSAKRASLIENLRSLRGFGKMRVR